MKYNSLNSRYSIFAELMLLYVTAKSKIVTSLDILDEMRPIRCIEHKGPARKIPLAGNQQEINKAFELGYPSTLVLHSILHTVLLRITGLDDALLLGERLLYRGQDGIHVLHLLG